MLTLLLKYDSLHCSRAATYSLFMLFILKRTLLVLIDQTNQILLTYFYLLACDLCLHAGRREASASYSLGGLSVLLLCLHVDHNRSL